MTGHSAVALDVGGVVYYDEPFELAWLQDTFDRLQATDPTLDLRAFLEHVERFYHYGEGDPTGRTWLHSEIAALSWSRVRQSWGELAQEIPGAVRAVTRLARELPVVIVANQPPECADVLARWQVSQVCREVLLDSLVGVAKPDPALLGLALRRLAIPPAELLVVGNRTDHDVLPALGLGCPVAFVLPDPAYRRPPGVHPDLVRVYTELRAFRTGSPPADARVTTVASLAALADSPLTSATPRSNAGTGGL
ncbi:HAD family hydrolase [Micromonospora sp. KC207]|uniref:HAD family hydrolase n=1 Tax=Micromonospora sp. KC207 TaxID=2530377 RepID=UPI00104AE919|nr:HAD family hydrolase [Micromonospora sp. KC207]TDC67351.1 HAD family hydrolase [Micromonospora sp. KC207]